MKRLETSLLKVVLKKSKPFYLDPINFRDFGYLENRVRGNGARIQTFKTRFPLTVNVKKEAHVIRHRVNRLERKQAKYNS